MSKIKVLHIVKSLGRGGAEVLLVETLKKHDKNKFEFFYIYFLPWKNQLVESLEKEGGVVINVPAKNNLLILFNIFSIIKIAQQNKVQLIHTHLPWAGIAGRLAGLFMKMPVIYSEHNIQERYHPLTKKLNNWTYNLQQMVIAVSNDVAISIKKNIKPRLPVKTIFNGVDVDAFKRNLNDRAHLKKELNIDENAIILGNVCVFRKQKRLLDWVNIFERIHQRFPNTVGVLVGAGLLFDEVKTYIHAKGLDGKISLVGLQPNVKAYLSLMDIFISTTEFEGMPIALLEAMSMECAIVTTDAGGVKDVIEDGVNGLSVPVAELNLIEEAVAKLITDEDLRAKLSIAARVTVLEKFSIKRVTLELENCYEQLIQKPTI